MAGVSPLLLLPLEGEHVLVYWIDEGSVSVVHEELVDGVSSIGEISKVKCGKKTHEGKTAARGT